MSWKYSTLSEVSCLHCGKNFLADLFYDDHFDKNGRPKLRGGIVLKEGSSIPSHSNKPFILQCPSCNNFMNAYESLDVWESNPKFKKVFIKVKRKSSKNFLYLFLKKFLFWRIKE